MISAGRGRSGEVTGLEERKGKGGEGEGEGRRKGVAKEEGKLGGMYVGR